MRLVTIKAPSGDGKKIVEVAFEAGIVQVTVGQTQQYKPGQPESVLDVVEVQTATPKAKAFLESLMDAPFYNPDTYAIAVRHPEAIMAAEAPAEETYPIVRPSTDVYQELWQFNRVTVSLVGRVFLASVLLSYGMVKGSMPVIIAGLLFLPYHHFMLGIGLGAVLREVRFLTQALLALALATILILLGGVTVAFFTEPPIGYQEFGTPLAGLALATIIGAAAALAAMDDAGRRELIGLAATAHISIYPAWFGLKLVFGFQEGDKWQEHLLTFGLNVTVLIVAAALTFAVMGMKGEGIRRFVRRKTGMA